MKKFLLLSCVCLMFLGSCTGVDMDPYQGSTPNQAPTYRTEGVARPRFEEIDARVNYGGAYIPVGGTTYVRTTSVSASPAVSTPAAPAPALSGAPTAPINGTEVPRK